jgi:hypothetical protein
MSGRERLHDDELVIRCGKPPFDLFKLITEGCVDHPDGHFGFSVRCAPGAAIEKLAAWCRNNKIGWTTVGTIRSAGYEVVITSPVERDHATVVVPKDWGMDAARTLMGFFEELTNPVPKERRP